MLMQISEPGQAPEPHQRKLAVGIDLGTTNSLVATVRNGSAQTLADIDGVHLLPSAVHYGEDAQIDIGEKALAVASADPRNSLLSIKRLMGRSYADVIGAEGVIKSPCELLDLGQDMVKIRTRAGDLSPVQVSSEILKSLGRRAEETLGGELTGVVITVPAYFDDAQRQATKDAAKIAGLNVLRLLNEPTAAAVAYGLDQQDEVAIAVFDLGGGTFDVSVLQLTKGVFEVLSTGGDSALGGDDFDHMLAQWFVAENNMVSLDMFEQRSLLTAAREAKEALSDVTEVQLSLGGISSTLSRQQFNELIDPLIDKAIRACKRALRDAKLPSSEIHNVVMVGGSTRVPRVRERVTQWFGREPLVDLDPDKVVALGAALQADQLVGNRSG
ncbi:Hsp70 family protein, partial [Zhongshania sp.]|uniref:Hsp70 family protein n=1 Tax=Zhongshania sp. TaxID=1971902 RepID=UPI0039E6974F